MVEINKSLDGTLEKAISASAQLKKMPDALQSFMLRGDFIIGRAKKVKASDLRIDNNAPKFDSTNNSGIQNLAAQLAGLDKSQQNAVFKMSDLSDAAQNATQSLLGEAAAGNQLSGVLVDNQLKTLDLTQSTRERILQEAKLVDGSGKYKMATAADVKSTLEKQFAMQDCSEALKSAGQNEQQLATTIVKTVVGQQAQTATTWAQKFAIDALSATLSIAKQALIAFVIGFATKKIQEWYKSITEVDEKLIDFASDSKKVSDKSTDLSSSISDLISQYEKLGDSADWKTDDIETAKNLNNEIYETLKSQDDIDKGILSKIDLQNGKYKDQLALLRQIQLTQLENAEKSLENSKEDQGKVLKDTAKKKVGNGDHIISDSIDQQMAEYLKKALGSSFDENTGVFKLADYDVTDADSVLGYYNKLTAALSVLEKHFEHADLESSSFYNSLKKDSKNLSEAATSYQEFNDQLKDNLVTQGKLNFSNDLSDSQSKEFHLSKDELDAKVKATQEYQDAVKAAQKTEEEWDSKGYGVYGNVDNFNRDKIDWNVANRKKYSEFVKENPDDTAPNNYSTVIGGSTNIDGLEMAYTPMLQTENGLVPLTEDQLWNYLDTIIDKAYGNNKTIDINKLMEFDSTGLDEEINGEIVRVKGMIAGIEGQVEPNGHTLTKADIMARAGSNAQEIAADSYEGDDRHNVAHKMGTNFTLDVAKDPLHNVGSDALSDYVGKSMHDAQALAQEGKDHIEDVYKEIYNDLENQNVPSPEDSSQIRYFSHVKSAFDVLANSLGKTSSQMTMSDVLGLTADGAELTDEQASAIETLTAAANKYGTTIAGVAQASQENGFFGSEELLAQSVQQMETISQNIDNIQSAYKACTTAMEEYNKYGYMSTDALQGLLSMNDEYLACLDVVDGKLKVNNERYADLIAAQYTEAEATAIEQAVNELNALQKEDAKEKTEGLTTATEVQQTALENAIPAIQEATSATGDLAIALATAQGAAGDDEEMQAKIDTITTALNTKLTAIHTNMQAALKGGKELKNQLNGFDKNKSGNSASKSVTDVASAFDTLTKAMKEYNQYSYISADTMKSMMKLEDKFTSCLVKNGDKLAINANEFRKLVETQLKEEEASGKASKSADELKRILGYLDKNVKSETISFEQLTDVIKGYGTAMDDAKEKTDAIKSAFSDLYDVGTKKNDNDFGFLDADSVEKKYQAIRNLYDKTDLFTNPAYKDALNSETGEIDYNSDAFKQMFADHLAQLATSARETGGEAGKYLAQGFEDAAAKISQNVISIREYIDGIGSSLKYATDRIDHFQSGFSDISDIVKEYNTYGGLSIDNYQKLMSLDDDYIKCLSLEEGQLKFNTKAYKDLFVAKLLAMADEYDKAKETAALAQRLRELAAAVEKSGDGFTMATDSAKNFEDTLSNIKSLLSDLIGVFEQFNTDKSNDLKIQGDAWLEVIDKRIDALNEQNDAQERAIELSKAQDALEKAKANKTVHVYHAGGSGFEWEADQNAVRDAQSTLDDTIRKNRKEDEIERLNKLKKAVQENNELIGSSFEDYEKKKKYLAEFDKMTYDDMISYNENWKNSIIGNMKSTQVVTNVNEIITKIEKLITTLETLNNVLTAIRTHGASTDGGGLTGLFGKNGLFGMLGDFIDKAKTKGLETAAKETIGTFLDNTSAALEANADNPIIKAATGLWDKLKGIFSGKIVATGVEAGVDETLATLAKKEVVQKGAGNLLTRFGGAAAATGAKTATTVTTGISSIPVVGTLIAVAVNNAVQQFGKISKENIKIWADQNSTTGEKIVSSIGNVLYHLSPVEGWDKSVQYAKMAAKGEGLWQRLEYGAKSLYYATGLGVMLDNIWSTIKSILKVFGVKFKEGDDDTNPPSHVPDKKGVGSWKIWPWNWGKKAKGDKKIKKSAPYNVDEEGDEIIVRKPQTGRMTYLEKGDGVIPANETENLMTIGKNPLKWLTENVGKILGASAAKDVVEGKVDEGAVTKASQVLASSVVNTFSSAWNTVKMSTEDLIDSMNDSFQGGSTSVTTAAGTILGRVKTMFGKFNLGKLLGSFSSGVSGAISKSAKEYSSTTELLSGTKSKTIDTMNKMRSTFESTWASVAKETGVSKDKITSISSEMFSKMETLVNQTYDAIDSNAGMSSDQLNDITKSLFQSMQSIYTSGWNAVYATSTGMSQETANTLNSAYKSSSDGCTKAMDTIRNTMVGSWEQCGGGVQNLANGTYQTLSKAWADSSGSAEKMLYDTRACFDSGWGAVEQGVSNLANNPKDKLSTAWAEITSQSNATFGAEGTLKTDADNAWKNVEPGATNLSKNMQWTMDQAYLATKQGCSDTVNSVNTNLNSTSAGFSAIASAIDAVNKKASDSEEVAKNTGHAWYEWVLNPVGTLLDTVTKYNTEDKSKNNFLQNAVHTVTHPISSVVESVKYLGNAAKDFFGGLFGKHASGLKSASKSHFANVDELGPELLVRKPQSGRYTYLETGDGVVPADITSKLFEMGGNPNKWFSEQMAKYGSQAITTKSTGNTSFSTGNIVINNPVGNSEDLASEIKKNFSTRMAQEWNKR